MLGITETWLSEQVSDAEVNVPGFSILRSDRKGRVGGGIALYLREDITGDILAQFDNGTCEMIIVMVHQLNTVVAVCYRPPNTRFGQFSGMLDLLDSTISSLPSPTPNLVWMGDFNFTRNCIEWQVADDGDVIPVMKGQIWDLHQEERKLDRQQARSLLDTAAKFSMQQVLSEPNHGREVLNLLLVNNHELVSHVKLEEWPDFSDHRLVKVNTNFQLGIQEDVKVEQHLTAVAKRYKSLNFQKAPWEIIEENLGKVDWSDMENKSPNDALAAFHDRVLDVLEQHVPQKAENPRVRK